MPAGRSSRYVAAALFIGMLVPLATSQDVDPAAQRTKQREEQKKIKARIDEASRRLGSTIDAMAYQRLSPNTERKMLEGVANDVNHQQLGFVAEEGDRGKRRGCLQEEDVRTAATDSLEDSRGSLAPHQLFGRQERQDVFGHLERHVAELERS